MKKRVEVTLVYELDAENRGQLAELRSKLKDLSHGESFSLYGTVRLLRSKTRYKDVIPDPDAEKPVRKVKRHG